MLSPSLTPSTPQELSAALAEAQRTAEEAQRALQSAQAQIATLTRERDQLRKSYELLLQELELLRRRIFAAKAERIDTRQLELDFAAVRAELDRVAGMLPREAQAGEGEKVAATSRKKQSGRRDLRALPLPEDRIEIPDVLYEQLVAEEKATRIGFEESCRVAYRRGGPVRVVVARVKYQTTDVEGLTHVETAPLPPESFPRSLAAPSMLAHVCSEKFCDGLPLNRVENRLGRRGFTLDRGTMSRWVEDAGATLGATVVAAARREAFETAFCIATDATGVAVQPEPREDGRRQACRRAHYFVLIADRDHIFFEFTPKETSETVFEMFRGFSGYVHADAKSVYDVLFKKAEKPPDDFESRTEVGCWSHCRRKYWEAACAKSELGREGLARIGWMFTLEDSWRKDPPEVIQRMRNEHLRPHMEAFFAWAEAQYEEVRDQRGMLRSAFGYAVRQKDALMRVLEDGRLLLDNNRSERELRRIAVGRRAWLFVGSDGHGESAGHILSLVASARLHGLDPEEYLRDVFRVLAHWPRERYLELCPKYWARTRVLLDPKEMTKEIGFLTIPPPLELQPSKQETPAN